MGSDNHASVIRIDAAPEIGTVIGQVTERTTPERDVFHIPKFDVFRKGGVVGGEQIVVVHGKSTSVEGGDIIGDITRRSVVFVGIDFDCPAVIAEDSLVRLNDAAGGKVADVRGETCAYATHCVFDGGAIAEFHLALVLRQLPLGAVALYFNALPHLPRTGGGQSSAVHDEFSAGADDEAGIGRHLHLACDSKCYS